MISRFKDKNNFDIIDKEFSAIFKLSKARKILEFSIFLNLTNQKVNRLGRSVTTWPLLSPSCFKFTKQIKFSSSARFIQIISSLRIADKFFFRREHFQNESSKRLSQPQLEICGRTRIKTNVNLLSYFLTLTYAWQLSKCFCSIKFSNSHFFKILCESRGKNLTKAWNKFFRTYKGDKNRKRLESRNFKNLQDFFGYFFLSN